jgi:hypothetical protein
MVVNPPLQGFRSRGRWPARYGTRGWTAKGFFRLSANSILSPAAWRDTVQAFDFGAGGALFESNSHGNPFLHKRGLCCPFFHEPDYYCVSRTDVTAFAPCSLIH